jgi:hypothetical protein
MSSEYMGTVAYDIGGPPSKEAKLPSAIGLPKKVGFRRGKWTAEEEAYANRLIHEFKLGMLPLTDGTTLRTFLSKLLNCDPMRISKKFVGQNCIGKQVFRRRPSDLDKLTEEQLEKTRRELSELERLFLERVAQTNRSQRSVAVVVKGGRMGMGIMPYNNGNGEGGGTKTPPWMRPPDHDSGGGGGYTYPPNGGSGVIGVLSVGAEEDGSLQIGPVGGIGDATILGGGFQDGVPPSYSSGGGGQGQGLVVVTLRTPPLAAPLPLIALLPP